MWRNTTAALFAMMALALLAPDEASAARRGVGGGYRAVGYHAGAVRTYPGYRPWRRYPVAPVAAAAVVGAGLAYAAYPYRYGYDYGYGNYYANGYGYYPSYGYAGDIGFDGCAIIHRRIPTAEGWVMQPIQVCN